jgi:L-lactate dehydrogenase complex protein LldG
MPTPVEDPNKEAFLTRVRDALGRTSPIMITPDHPTLKTTLPRHEEKIRTTKARTEARRSQNIARLESTAIAASWHMHRASDAEIAANVVAEIASSIHAKNVVRTAEDIFKRVNTDATLRKRGVRSTVLASGRVRRKEDLKEIAFKADMGISGVEYAIAETASCAVFQRKGNARIATLAPPVLALIVEESKILETLDDFFAIVRFQFLTNRGRLPNYYNFISGPSRTADIEQTLTVGVHGPGEVHMILLADGLTSLQP